MSATTDIAIDIQNLINEKTCHCITCEANHHYPPQLSDYDTDEEWVQALRDAPRCQACWDYKYIIWNEGHDNEYTEKCWCTVSW